MTDPVIAAIHGRRSVARVLPDPIPRQLVEELVAAAVRAPNHNLTHPWRFVVLTGTARREVSPRLERAPVVVACCVAGSGEDPVRRREDRDAVAAGVQNLLLAAHAHGLGAMWRTGALVDDPAAREALGLGEGEEVVAFVYVGAPDGPPTPASPRPALDEVVEWRGW